VKYQNLRKIDTVTSTEVFLATKGTKSTKLKKEGTSTYVPFVAKKLLEF
jgi:hypothetical protein